MFDSDCPTYGLDDKEGERAGEMHERRGKFSAPGAHNTCRGTEFISVVCTYVGRLLSRRGKIEK